MDDCWRQGHAFTLCSLSTDWAVTLRATVNARLVTEGEGEIEIAFQD